jgi:cytochrome c oxidase cbb3-type subunit 4
MDVMSFVDGAKLWSLLGVFATFVAIVVYALWPSFQSKFDEAARLPLNED